MPKPKEPNPYRRLKDRLGVTWAELADVLGISHSYARQLGSGMSRSIPASTAQEFERRTQGGLKARELLLWGLQG